MLLHYYAKCKQELDAERIQPMTIRGTVPTEPHAPHPKPHAPPKLLLPTRCRSACGSTSGCSARRGSPGATQIKWYTAGRGTWPCSIRARGGASPCSTKAAPPSPRTLSRSSSRPSSTSAPLSRSLPPIGATWALASLIPARGWAHASAAAPTLFFSVVSVRLVMSDPEGYIPAGMYMMARSRAIKAGPARWFSKCA